MNSKYNPSEIEKKWQEVWAKEGIYKFSMINDKESKEKDKYYALVELPYPSGDLHIGHWFSFATADVHARIHRMLGKNVFFTNGFDAFGLPAENAAIKRGVHPKDWTMSNIATMKKQFDQMGTMIDWTHETITCLPEYYKWNQWIFIEMFKKGLAYKGKAMGNWCPKDLTVLANEHVESGKCWRCGTEVIQKEVEQWFIKLTAYAEKLIWKDDQQIDWPNSVKVAQNQWIGKKVGMKIKHTVVDSNIHFETFTAFPAWSWADTYIVIAPEHPLVKQLIKDSDTKKQVMDFIEETAKITTSDRNEERFEKKGVFTGKYAKDPFGGKDMPIWVANFALINFGTGIIRCSGHDPRDIEFAQKYNIPIKEVVARVDPNTPVNAHDNKGILKNSGPFTGRDVVEVIPEVIDWIEKQGIGEKYINYHIHDWSISRQRYWGTPVPMINCEKCGVVPVPLEQLPVELPYDVDFAPKGKAPLATAKEWMQTTCPNCKGAATRDPETLDTFFDSSWYFFRYLDPFFKEGPFDKELAKKLLPVDIYFGGAEHTLGHTLYARFFTKFFKELGLVDFDEFAKKRVQHGVILGTDGNRMSKSKGNVVNPDDVVKEYGADAVRVYLCFMMPYDATAPWNIGGMWGVYRFLKRVWDLKEKINTDINATMTKEDLYQMHTSIAKIALDGGSTKFNTCISTLMKWINHLSLKEKISLTEYRTFLLLLAPFAPHIAEELWQEVHSKEQIANGIIEEDNLKDHTPYAISHKQSFKSIHQHSFPVSDKQYLQQEEVVLVAQINGKVRDNVKVEFSIINNQKEIEEIVKKNEKIKKYLDGKEIKKVIYILGKVINFVVV